jgi:hypothetical protein
MVDLDHKKYVKTKNLGFTKMKKRSQKLIFKYDYLTSLQSVQINGERRYLYGDEKLPSVTTVLGKTKDQTFLDEWKKRIGELEAEEIIFESSTIGTALHKTVEFFLKNKMLPAPKDTLVSKGYEMGYKIINTYMKNFQEVWGSEVSIFYPGKYAGTIDAVGVYDGEPTVIDFKQSKRQKKIEWVDDYFHQLAAYAMAHDKLYKTKITTGRVLMAVQDGTVQEFVIRGNDLENYKLKFMKRLEELLSQVPQPQDPVPPTTALPKSERSI